MRSPATSRATSPPRLETCRALSLPLDSSPARWAAVRELAASLPSAEFRLVDTGHTPRYEAPAAVAAAVRDVLERTLAERRE